MLVTFEMQEQPSIPHPVGSNHSRDVDLDCSKEKEDIEAPFYDIACASNRAKVNGQVRAYAWMFHIKTWGFPFCTFNLGNNNVIQHWKELFMATSEKMIRKNPFIAFVIQNKDAPSKLQIDQEHFDCGWEVLSYIQFKN